MTYRHLIFDFDGTLANSFPWFLNVMDEVADRFRLARLPKGDVEKMRTRNARDLIASARIPVWKLPFIARHVKNLMARDIGQIQLFDGVQEMLDTLAAQGVRLTLASSNSRENVATVLGPEALRHFTDFECGVSLFGKAAKYRKIFKRTPYSAAETLCIGDELRDLDAAREAGLPFGAVSWGCTHGPALVAQEPEHYFEAVGEIVDLVCPAAPLQS